MFLQKEFKSKLNNMIGLGNVQAARNHGRTLMGTVHEAKKGNEINYHALQFAIKYNFTANIVVIINNRRS